MTTDTNIALRNAIFEDAPSIARVERESWPTELAANEQQIRERIRVFPQGQWIAERDGVVIGVLYAQRITQEFLDKTPIEYDLLTDHGNFVATHRPDGNIYQLISVGVSPAGRGVGVGRRLVDQHRKFAWSLPGIVRVIGFTRPSAYSHHAKCPIDKYVQLRRDDGRLVDPTLAFHLDAGAQLVSTHAGYRPEDRQAQGFGVLIEYRPTK